MSQQENDEEGKITEVDNSEEAAGKSSTLDSDATFNKTNVDVANALDNLKLPSSSDSDESNASNEDLSRARDSLECLPNREKLIAKSQSCTTSKDKYLISESPHSESLIGGSKNACSSSVAKVFSWDPWDKLSRKNKKDSKRRKVEKSSNEPNCSTSMGKENRKDFKSGDESASQARDQGAVEEDGYEEYAYQPFQKQSRSVEFTNEVMVVYVNKEDKVVGETSEPLKKELEQQKRNKEMRRGHMPDATFARRNSMSEWFRK